MPVWFYFLLTLAIELPIAFFIFRKEGKFALLICFLLNLFTWPLLHVILFSWDDAINKLLLLELGIAIVESIGYKLLMKCDWQKALVAGFVANIASYGIGLLANYLF
jgi:hypothetical protein